VIYGKDKAQLISNHVFNQKYQSGYSLDLHSEPAGE
jgi:hypothetical protein